MNVRLWCHDRGAGDEPREQLVAPERVRPCEYKFRSAALQLAWCMPFRWLGGDWWLGLVHAFLALGMVHQGPALRRCGRASWLRRPLARWRWTRQLLLSHGRWTRHALSWQCGGYRSH